MIGLINKISPYILLIVLIVSAVLPCFLVLSLAPVSVIDIPTVPTNVSYSIIDGSTCEILWDKGYCRSDWISIEDTCPGNNKALGTGNYESIFHYDEATYFVWGDTDPTVDPIIRVYNETLDYWDDPVEIDDGGGTGDSDHNRPAVAITDNGTIHVLMGTHNSNVLYYTSDNPLNASAFTEQATLGYGTYQKLYITSNNSLFMWYRSGNTYTGDCAYRVSYDNGTTWQAAVNLIDYSGYATGYFNVYYDSDDNYFHIAWTLGDAAGKYKVFYCYYDLNSWTCYNAAGSSLGATINTADHASCVVINSAISTSYECKTPILVVDEDNTPYIFTPREWGLGSDFTQYFSYYTGGSWIHMNVTTMGWPNTGNFAYCYNSKCIELWTKSDCPNAGGYVDHYIWDSSDWRYVNRTFWYQTLNCITGNFDGDYKYNMAGCEYDDPGEVWVRGGKVYTVVRYSPSNNLTTYTSGYDGGSILGQNITLTGLSPGVEYWVRCWSYSPLEGYNPTGSSTITFVSGFGGSEYFPPVIVSMGYTGSGDLGDVNVTVDTFWVNWSYDTTGTPTSHHIDIASDTEFLSIVWNYNVTHASVVEGDYCNITISNFTASTSKRYMHIRSFYGGIL